MLGLAVSIDQSGKEQFGPVKDLSPLGDMVFVNLSFIQSDCIVNEVFIFSISLCLGWFIGS